VNDPGYDSSDFHSELTSVSREDKRMELEFRRADVDAELRRLRDFDRKVFPAADLFPASYWRVCEVWWMLVDGRRAGCCALRPHADLSDDLDADDTPAEGVLYISSTGLLPAYQGRGLGAVMKAWQVAYARRNGFRRVVANTRAGNARMIELNQQFAFRVTRRIPGYYADPDEGTVVMELSL